MNTTVIGIATLLYNLTLIVGATYLVVEYQWSMWIYLLAALFITSIKTGDKV